jgi:putative SOS response-associated peptidase YedK
VLTVLPLGLACHLSPRRRTEGAPRSSSSAYARATTPPRYGGRGVRLPTSTTPRDRLARLLDVDEVDAPELPIRWNVASTQPVYALIGDRRGARALSARRWGLVPHWSTDPRIASRLINARGETAAERPAFREALRQRRTALVFDGFYEWRRPGPGEKGPAQPFYFYPADGQPLLLAGLWDTWYQAEHRPLKRPSRNTARPAHSLRPV